MRDFDENINENFMVRRCIGCNPDSCYESCPYARGRDYTCFDCHYFVYERNYCRLRKEVVDGDDECCPEFLIRE